MSELIFWAVPAFLGLLAFEALLVNRRPVGDTPVRGYESRDTATSLAMGVGNVAIAGAVKAAVFVLYLGLYELRLFDWKQGIAYWVALVIAEDVCYYCFHRTSHEVRFLWAAHENHHSSRFYNLSTALRQSWTSIPYVSSRVTIHTGRGSRNRWATRPGSLSWLNGGRT